MDNFLKNVYLQFLTLLNNTKLTLYLISDEQYQLMLGKFPIWKHLYHCLHSLDQWFINPNDYQEPSFHVENLNSLINKTEKKLTKIDLIKYFNQVAIKINNYLLNLNDNLLLEKPINCDFNKISLIVGQVRHASYHIGFVHSFIYQLTGKWIDFTGMSTIPNYKEIIQNSENKDMDNFFKDEGLKDFFEKNVLNM
jgi:hypothetical protein